MVNYSPPKVVGTIHISKESIENVKRVIQEEKPNFVAVELDSVRYNGLKNRGKESSTAELINAFGISAGIFLKVLSFVQKELGKRVGVMPGTEMLVAVEEGEKIGAEIVFIDQDIGTTFKRILKYVSFGEKLKLFWAALNVFTPKFSQVKLGGHIDEGMIDYLLKTFQKEFPNLYKVLVEERNIYMAEQLRTLCEKGKVVAVVGIGHKKGLEEITMRQSKVLNISFMYTDECPLWEEGYLNLKDAIKKMGINAKIQRAKITSMEAAENHCLRGTPTILINGVDIQKDSKLTPYLGCRFYYYDGKMHHNPSVGQIQEAIRKIIGG